MQPGQLTVPRLPTLVTSAFSSYLPLCAPLEPSKVASASAAAPGGVQPVPPAPLLHAVCRALLSTDTSHLQPRLPVQQVVPQPGTLEYALVELNPHVFQGVVGSGHVAPPPGQHAQQQHDQQGQHSSAASRGRAERPASAAAGAAAGAEEEHAAKRRKTTAATSEQYVSRTVDAQQVAAAVAEDINSFITKAAAMNNDQGVSVPQADSSTGPAAAKRSRKTGAQASQAAQRLEMLRQLQGSLAAGKQAAILSQLDQEQLRQLLLLLLDHVRLGHERQIDEQDMASSDSTQAVLAGLEAACCCMQVLAAPRMHSSLYMDELVTAAVNLAKYQLQYNVLALHDAQLKRLYRPTAAAQDAVLTSAGKRKMREWTPARPPKVLVDVRAKLELLLSLLAQAVQQFVLEVELLLPLVRVALTCLSVDSLQLLQAQAVALATSVFRAHPEQRSSLADEVLTTVVAAIHISGKAPPRLFEATGPNLEPLPIMMATALIMQLVQVSVELPEVASEAQTIQMGFKASHGWSEYIWQGIFAKLPAAKAAKTEGATDFKLVVQALLADLLTVQMLPEWPAANILLRRFIKQLASDNGLKHKDAAVKLACVEFTGQLATALSMEVLAADRQADEVQAVKEEAQAAADSGGAPVPLQEVPDLLLLDYLAASRGSSDNSSASSNDILASARRFACARMLHDVIHADPAQPIKEQQALKSLLVQHRRLQDSQAPALGGAAAGLQLSRGQVVKLLRQSAMRGQFGAARGALIKWLLEAGSRHGADPSPATVRTKVFKCLGAVVEADSRVMALPEVAAAVQAAQEDDSAAVKEAVLELLVKLINTNPQLAGQYFETLLAASYDQGISVRKRAIRALWECCSCPGFSRASDAVLAVLKRANDKEDSMRTLVTKICGDMFFTEASSFAGLSDGEPAAGSPASSTRTAAVRAAELAALALQLYEASGKTIHVPLPPDHGLIVIFEEVLGTGSSSSTAAAPSAKELKEQAVLRQGAVDMADTLLNMTLQQQQQETADDSLGPESGSGGGCFQYLLALHILTAADPSVAAPVADPQRFARCLAPYISALANASAPTQLARASSAGAGGSLSSEDSVRRAAEEALCLLAVLEAVLSHLGCVEQDIAQQLANDLLTLLNKTRYLQLIAASCQLLCTLAGLYAPAAGHVTQLANRVYNLVAMVLSSSGPAGTPGGSLAAAPRLLYVLGQLCRYGADVLDASAAQDTKNRNCTECLELCVSLWYKQDLPEPQLQRVREGALQALGLIIIGRPSLMLQPLRLSSNLETQPSVGATATSAHSGGSGDAGSPSDNGQDGRQQLSAQGSGVLQSVLSGANVMRVYTSTLSDPQVPLAVKGRVLASLVELLRAEESALLARQKEAELSSTASRLPSTLPAPDSKAPLARVNGEGDAAGGSSSIIQRVWEDILRLATGVGGNAAGAGRGSNAGLPPPTPLGAAGVVEAAATRRKSLELIEVVLRGGLVAPWAAVPPLVAQLTDELPETRAAALKVLKTASEKYADFVANQLAPGVLEAFNFQSRLWAAKHPGQPLPKGPSPEVLEGLSAMYSDIIAATPGTRQRFLTALLKPFEAACNLAANPAAAAREDSSRLAFCAYVAANLPYKKADEPLVLLHVINSLVSRLAQEVCDVLRHALLRLGLRESMGLEEEEEDEAAVAAAAAGAAVPSQHPVHEAAAAVAGSLPPDAAAVAAGSEQRADAAEPHHQQQVPPQQQQQVSLPLALPLPQWLAAPLKASLGLSMLLVLKQYLMAVFALSDERVAQYELKGDKARAEAKTMVSRSKKTGEFSLSVVNLRAVQDGTGQLLAEQYKTYAALLDNDAANYKEAAVLAALADNADDEDAEAPAHGAKHVSATPAGAAGLVVYSMDAKTKSTRGRGGRSAASTGGRGSTAGRGTGRGRGAGRASSSRGGKKAKPRRRRFGADSDSSEGEAEADSGDEDWGSARASKARKLFD